MTNLDSILKNIYWQLNLYRMMTGLQCEEKGWKQVPNCSVKEKE